MSAIRTQSLRKDFGAFTAVRDVTFEVAEGESFGLLGPNGAGKSTLIRMLNTLLPPTSGSAVVSGWDVRKHPDAVRRSIGVIPQAFTSDPELTAAENLHFYGRLYGIRRSARRKLVDECLAQVDLEQWRRKPVGTFSGGMRRRLEIGRGLLHRPRILFLDEPTTGLDPASRLAMWEMILRLKSESALTLFLTTHYMEEADQLCDRVAICDRGEIIALDTPEGLKKSLTEHQWIEVRFASPQHGLGQLLESLPEVGRFDLQDGCWRIQSRDFAATVGALLEHSQSAAMQVDSLAIRGPSLEDVFIHFTGRDLRDSVSKSIRRDFVFRQG